MQVGGVVLCGGMSRRMGTSKAWLPVGREVLLQRVVRVVAEVVQPVVAAGRSDQSLPELPPEVLTAVDAIDDAGPLAGLAAGFDALAGRCEAAFVVSCDHALLTAPFVERMIALLDDEAGVVVEHGGRLHSLAAVYRLDTRSALDELIARREYRVREFVACCGARIVSADDLIEVDPQLDSLCNVNDAKTYERVLRSLGES